MLTRAADTSSVLLDGRGLDADSVARLADRTAEPQIDPAALAVTETGRRLAHQVAADGGRIYGRSTGVGANRGVAVAEPDTAGHDLRLLRSHAGGIGAPLPARQIRAMLAVRANQLLAGGSGLRPEIVLALTEALRRGFHPRVHEFGAIGTGDLTALAETGLTLIGQLPWQRDDIGTAVRATVAPSAGASGTDTAEPADTAEFIAEGPGAERAAGGIPAQRSADAATAEDGAAVLFGAGSGGVPADGGRTGAGVADGRLAADDTGPGRASRGAPAPVALESGDALALLSSSALTLGQAALVCHDLERLLRASHVVTALSLTAVRGSLEAYAAPVHDARPHPGSVRAAAEIRRLLGAPDRPAPPAGRVQDPFAFRCFAQLHGPALEARAALERVLAVELNCAAENPLISRDGPDGVPAAYHHGGFFAAPAALALDQLCLAVLQTGRLSAARLVALGRPDLTGLRAFLADGVSASSGVMILEHSANAALAEIQACAAPASIGHVVLAHGVEEAASFATQAARKALRAVEAYRLVLGCELVSAVRALRQHGHVFDPVLPAGRALALAKDTLDPDMADRPLTADVEAAAGLLVELADL